MEDLGTARQVRVTKDETTIVEGHGDQQAIKDRVAQIKAQIAETTSDFDKENFRNVLLRCPAVLLSSKSVQLPKLN